MDNLSSVWKLVLRVVRSFFVLDLLVWLRYEDGIIFYVFLLKNVCGDFN